MRVSVPVAGLDFDRFQDAAEADVKLDWLVFEETEDRSDADLTAELQDVAAPSATQTSMLAQTPAASGRSPLGTGPVELNGSSGPPLCSKLPRIAKTSLPISRSLKVIRIDVFFFSGIDGFLPPEAVQILGHKS